MACNSCSKPFNLLRREKGCPSCGFSYCSNCLNNRIFVKKLNAEAKVCMKCKQSANSNKTDSVAAPAAYYKRMANTSNDTNMPSSSGQKNGTDLQILQRLQKLKDDKKEHVQIPSKDEIAKRLDNLKGESPKATDAELHSRLANLKGVPICVVQSKPTLPAPDLRTEQEQAEDLLKQYMAQTKIDDKYETDFNAVVGDIESRLQKLKGQERTEKSADTQKKAIAVPQAETQDSDDEELARKIIERIKSMPADDDNISNDELPFCEICNEDAQVRCVGCQYLFCKRCYVEHKDDDDGCNSYVIYEPPKNKQI